MTCHPYPKNFESGEPKYIWGEGGRGGWGRKRRRWKRRWKRRKRRKRRSKNEEEKENDDYKDKDI